MQRLFQKLFITVTLTLISFGALAIEKRPFHPTLNGQWIGNGIAYSPYRDGESPDKQSLTSKAHILQDLKLIQQRWNLIRVYHSSALTERVLQVIKDNQLPIRVMLGAWISGKATQAENQDQVNRAIRLANQYPGIINSVNVGNEIFVDWSAHKIADMAFVIQAIRQVRAQIKQPVTVNDDYNFWNKPHAQKIVDEIDFIGLQAYAFWNNQTLAASMDWTIKTYQTIQALYPNEQIVYSETGWPTSRVFDQSYEGQLIGVAGMKQQKIFFDQYMNWVNQNQIISLYFEAFDENWKGGWDGEHPANKAEKHWGVYKANRQPKSALHPE